MNVENWLLNRSRENHGIDENAKSAERQRIDSFERIVGADNAWIAEFSRGCGDDDDDDDERRRKRTTKMNIPISFFRGSPPGIPTSRGRTLS